MRENDMRVLHVLGIMNRGGAETMIMNLYRTIDRDKVQFDFVVHLDAVGDYDREIKHLGGNIFYAPRYCGINHFAYIVWWEEFFQKHPEYRIVHSHIRSTASLILAMAKSYGRITIAHSHSTSNGSGIKAAVKRLLQFRITKYADYLLACSDDAGKWLFGEKATTGGNYRIFRNAIDVNTFSYDENARKKIREEFGLNESFVVGTVGRITTPKNPYGIIRIVQGICEQMPTAHFLWVGTGDLEPEVRVLVESSEIKNKVTFAGSRADVPELLSAMDVFLFPSLWEGLGIAVLEAQASGLPCMVSDSVPEEACVTPLVRRIPVDDIQQWVSAIMAVEEKTDRNDFSAEIKAAGYDIADTTKWLQDFYLQNG